MQVSRISFLGLYLGILMGCGYEFKTDPFALLTSDRTEIFAGEHVTFDASQSEFESLEWSLDELDYPTCIDDTTCVIAFDTPGTYEVSINATGSFEDTDTLQVRVRPASESEEIILSTVGMDELLGGPYPELLIPNPDLTPTATTDTKVTLSWNPAVSNTTIIVPLIYQVYYSTSGDLNTVFEAESDGILAAETPISIITISELEPDTHYYFNVVATDPYEQKSIYQSRRVMTGKPLSFDPQQGDFASYVNNTQLTANSENTILIGASDMDASSAILYLNDVSTPFIVEYEYLTDEGILGNPGQGMAFLFGVNPSDYEKHDLSEARHLGILGKSGYAISKETSTSVISLQGNVGNGVERLLNYYNDSIHTRGLWRRMRILVGRHHLQAYFEGQLALAQALNVDTTHQSIGFSAATVGGRFGLHQIRDVVLHTETPVGKPQVPHRGLSISGVRENHLTLHWQAAYDDGNPDETMEYQVFYSTVGSMATVASVETYGTPTGPFQAAGLRKQIDSLAPGVTYRFNVLTRNSKGRKAVYSPILFRIPETFDPGDFSFYDAHTSAGQSTTDVTDSITSTSQLYDTITLIQNQTPNTGTAVWLSQQVTLPITITFDYLATNESGVAFLFGNNIDDYQNSDVTTGSSLGLIEASDPEARYAAKFGNFGGPGDRRIFLTDGQHHTLASKGAATNSRHDNDWKTATVALNAFEFEAELGGRSASANHAYDAGTSVFIGFGAGTADRSGVFKIRHVRVNP